MVEACRPGAGGWEGAAGSLAAPLNALTSRGASSQGTVSAFWVLGAGLVFLRLSCLICPTDTASWASVSDCSLPPVSATKLHPPGNLCTVSLEPLRMFSIIKYFLLFTLSHTVLSGLCVVGTWLGGKGVGGPQVNVHDGKGMASLPLFYTHLAASCPPHPPGLAHFGVSVLILLYITMTCLPSEPGHDVPEGTAVHPLGVQLSVPPRPWSPQ